MNDCWPVWGISGERRERGTLSSPSANITKVPVNVWRTEKIPGVTVCNCDQIKIYNEDSPSLTSNVLPVLSNSGGTKEPSGSSAG